MSLRQGIKNIIRRRQFLDKRGFIAKMSSNNHHQDPQLSSNDRGCTSLQGRPKVKYNVTQPAAGYFAVPDFRDTATIYKNKNWRQLLRALLVFSLCSCDTLVKHQLKILTWSRRLLGLRMFRAVMRLTIYGQFMAGEKEEEVLAVAREHAQSGLYAMFSYTAAELHGQAKEAQTISSQKEVHVTNCAAIAKGLAMASAAKEFSYLEPQLAVKITYFINSDVLFNLNRLLTQQGAMIYDTLKGVDRSKSRQLQEYLSTVMAKSMVTYSGSGMVQPKGYEQDDLDLAAALATSLPFNLELSHSGELEKFAKDSSHTMSHLSHSEEIDVIRLWEKLSSFGQNASNEGVVLMFDAEQTYLQGAIECVVVDMMRKYNSNRPVIHNTYQCYLKKTMDTVIRDLELARKEGFCLGLKVVRGAYVYEEKMRAETMWYDDPINSSYDATTRMYERVAQYLLESLDALGPRRIHATFATHNEDTVKYVINRMNDYGINTKDRNVAFAQLLGMRDHITFSLGRCGIPVAKMSHYGIIEEGVAYLSRRLMENRSGLGTADLERSLVWTEIKRRLGTGTSGKRVEKD